MRVFSGGMLIGFWYQVYLTLSENVDDRKSESLDSWNRTMGEQKKQIRCFQDKSVWCVSGTYRNIPYASYSSYGSVGHNCVCLRCVGDGGISEQNLCASCSLYVSSSNTIHLDHELHHPTDVCK